MLNYDILANVIFFSEENGGRNQLPPIREKEYTYRPIIKFNNCEYSHCCGIIIGSYIFDYKFNNEIKNIKIIFLDKSKLSEHLFPGNKFLLLEGEKKIGEGTVVSIHEQ